MQTSSSPSRDSTAESPLVKWIKLLLGRPLALYSLATPFFVFCDVAWDWNFRVSFLAGYPLLKWGYYAVCLSFGLLSLRQDARFLPVMGLGESSVNILLLILSVMIPIFNLPAQVMSGEAISQPFGAMFFINFVISSVVFLYIFYTNPLVRRSPRLTR